MTPILGNIIPLEFANNEGEFIYDSIRFYGFPIAILLTLTRTLKEKDTSGIKAAKILGAIFVSAFSVFVMFMTLFSGMCDWTTDKVFFENNKNPATKIVQRSFGCGATDSSPSTIKVFKVREFTRHLIWVTSVDTSQINKNEWKRIE